MLASELAAGDLVVPRPGESVARMKIDLAFQTKRATPRTRFKRSADHCIATMSCLAFFSIRQSSGRPSAAESAVCRREERRGARHDERNGYGTALPELAARVGAALRAKLGLPGINLSQVHGIAGRRAFNAEATRLYFEGLGKLRNSTCWEPGISLTKGDGRRCQFFTGARLPGPSLGPLWATTEKQWKKPNRIRAFFAPGQRGQGRS